MDLQDAQIAEIKNLNLIYIFATDSIFHEDENKYIGAKIVFDQDKILAFDYKDAHFQAFIQKILDRYQKEKEKRKIILLGELTKKLMNDSSFAILEEQSLEGVQEYGIPALNTANRKIKEMEPYIAEVIKMILLFYKKYEVLQIEKIDGYHHKYMIYYKIGSIKKQMPILLSKRDENILDFKIKAVDDLVIPIKGEIVDEGGLATITWEQENENIKGQLIYNTLDDSIERKVVHNGISVVYDETKDTILEEDMEFLNFYFGLCNLDLLNHKLKINNHSFLLAEEKIQDQTEEEILYTTIGAKISASKDATRIQYYNIQGFSKYHNKINVSLDQEIENITFSKLIIEDKNYVLMECMKQRKNQQAYSYQIFEVEKNLDFRKPFSWNQCFFVDERLETLEHAKQYIIKQKGRTE